MNARPLVRYHGGKWRLAPWIIEHFPPHRIYVEPFGGGASVLIQKPRSYAEIYNDLDGEIVNLFRVARDRGEDLARAAELTPFSREEFHLAFEPAADPLEQARRTLFRSMAGFGGNLTRTNRDGTAQRTGFRVYSRDSGSHPASDWRNFPGNLRTIVERLRGVVIEQRDAIEVMRIQDSPDTLHYVDPPYVHETRTADSEGSHRGYRFEMTNDQHRGLAVCLRSLAGRVVLSGYRCDLYDELFGDWQRTDVEALADGARPRRESLWLNPAAINAQRQIRLQLPAEASWA